VRHDGVPRNEACHDDLPASLHVRAALLSQAILALEPRQRAQLWLVRALVAAGLALVFVPLVLTLYISVFDETLLTFPPRGYTLDWYGRILTEFGGPLRTSLMVSLAAVAISLLLGVPAGIGLSRYRFRGRSTISTLLLAPLTMPGIAIGLGIYVLAVLFEERTQVSISGSVWLMIAAHVLIALPWVVRLCVAALANHDRSAEEAAASLGAKPVVVIWRVTLPAMRSGIVAGGLFAFIVSFENLEMTLFLIAPGMTTLPISILQYLQYRLDPLVAAVAVAQVVLVGIALAVLDRQVRLSKVIA
jgi:putative spermidine/putrescine transport system permease protein